MTTVITANLGSLLRNYAFASQEKEGVAIFPEYGLSPVEQADYMSTEGYKFNEIITFSPFIISDAKVVKFLDLEHHDIRFGDSANKVIIRMGQRNTIGNCAYSAITEAMDSINSSISKEDVKEIIRNLDRELGDSVEKTLFIKSTMAKNK